MAFRRRFCTILGISAALVAADEGLDAWPLRLASAARAAGCLQSASAADVEASKFAPGKMFKSKDSSGKSWEVKILRRVEGDTFDVEVQDGHSTTWQVLKSQLETEAEATPARPKPPTPQLEALDCILAKWYVAKATRFSDMESETTHEAYLADGDSEGRQLGHSGTYGEITPVGVTQVFEKLQSSGIGLSSTDAFFDLGSGTGRMVMQAFLTSDAQRTVGVELGTKRHQIAVNARLAALSLYAGDVHTMEFVQGNILHESRLWSEATVMYLASLAFDLPLLVNLGWKLSESLWPGTIVFSLRDFPGCYPSLLRVGSVRADMTWSESSSEVLMFVVTPPAVSPQPTWLSTSSATAEAVIENLKYPVPKGNISRTQWVNTGRRAWQNCDANMLWRLLTTAAPALGLEEPTLEGGVPRETAHGVVRAQLTGSVNQSAVHCAAEALIIRAQLALQGLDDEEQPLTLEQTQARQGLSLEQTLARVSDVHAVDAKGRQLAWVLAGLRDERVALRALAPVLAKGALADNADKLGRRPLGRAVRHGHVAVASMLLEHRVDAESGDEAQRRPLHYAALHGHVGMVRLLIDHGADTAAKDAIGKTPQDLVKKNAQEALLRAFDPPAPKEEEESSPKDEL